MDPNTSSSSYSSRSDQPYVPLFSGDSGSSVKKKRNEQEEQKSQAVVQQKHTQSLRLSKSDVSAMQKTSPKNVGHSQHSTLKRAAGPRLAKNGAEVKLGAPTLKQPQPSQRNVAQGKELQSNQPEADNGIDQLAEALKNYLPPEGEDIGTSLEKMIAAAMQKTPEEVTNSSLHQTANSQLEEMRRSANVSYNGKLAQLIKEQPAAEQKVMTTIKQNPEFHKLFQAKQAGTVKQFDQLKQQAGQLAGSSTVGKTFKTMTTGFDDAGTAKIMSFEKQVRESDLPSREKNMLNRMFAGEDKAKFPPQLAVKFNDFMKNAQQAGKLVSDELAEMLPEDANPDLERVSAALQDDVNVEEFISSQLSENDPSLEEAMKLFQAYKRAPAAQSDLSPRLLRLFQEANSDQHTTASELAHKYSALFQEGWHKQYMNARMADSPKLTREVAEALREPATALVKKKGLTANQKGALQQLVNAGLQEVGAWTNRQAKQKNETRNVQNFLNKCTQAAREAGIPMQKIHALRAKLQKGEVSLAQFVEALGAAKVMQEVAYEAGMLAGETFALNPDILQEVLQGMSHSRMAYQYKAAEHGYEMISTINELIAEMQAARDTPPPTAAAPAAGNVTTTTTSTSSTVSVGDYYAIMQQFADTMNETLVSNQISNLQAQGEMTRAKALANQYMQQQAFDAQTSAEQSQAEQQQKHGIFHKIIGSIKVVVELSAGPVLLMSGNPALIAMGMGMTVSASKNIKQGGWGGAMQVGLVASLSQGMAMELELCGVPQAKAEVIASTLATAVAIAVIVALAAVSIIAAVPTGGASLGLFAALAIAGGVLMAASAVTALTAEYLVALQEQGVINGDWVGETAKILNIVSISLALVGLVLCLPTAFEEGASAIKSLKKAITELPETIGDMLSGASASMSEFFGSVDNAAVLGGGIVDDSIDLGGGIPRVEKSMQKIQQLEKDVAKVEQDIVKVEGEIKDIQQQMDEVSARSAKLEREAGEVESARPGATPEGEPAAAVAGPSNIESAANKEAQAAELKQEMANLEEAHKAKQKQLKKLTEDAKEMQQQIIQENAKPELKRDIPITDEQNKQIIQDGLKKADWSESDWKEMESAWKEMSMETRAECYQGIDVEKNADHVKKLDKLSYEISDDLSKARLNKFFGELDVGKKIESDLEYKTLIKDLRKIKAIVEFITKSYEYVQTCLTEERNIKSAKYQAEAERYQAVAERMQQFISSLDNSLKQVGDLVKEGSDAISQANRTRNAQLTAQFDAMATLFRVDVTGLTGAKAF